MTGKGKSAGIERFWKLALGGGSMLVMFFLLLDADGVAGDIRKGLTLAVYRVMPSVFPYLVLSGLITGSGLPELLERRVGKGFQRLTGFSGCSFAAILMGIISGFPVGAKCAGDLYQRGAIGKEEGERLAAFCNFCGPPFVIGVVGVGIFSSVKVGVILFLAQTVSALLFGFFYRRNKSSARKAALFLPVKEERLTFSLFTEVMTSSCLQMLRIGGFILFFGVLIGTVSRHMGGVLNDLPMGDALFSGFLEMSSGIARIDETGPLAVVAAALILGFSGCSVHMQVAGFMNERGLSMKGYFTAHLLCPPLTAFLALVLCRVFNIF